jgi:hypothetical protein
MQLNPPSLFRNWTSVGASIYHMTICASRGNRRSSLTRLALAEFGAMNRSGMIASLGETVSGNGKRAKLAGY